MVATEAAEAGAAGTTIASAAASAATAAGGVQACRTNLLKLCMKPPWISD
jgi:hypothetical protein